MQRKITNEPTNTFIQKLIYLHRMGKSASIDSILLYKVHTWLGLWKTQFLIHLTSIGKVAGM